MVTENQSGTKFNKVMDSRIIGDLEALDDFAAEMEKVENALPRHLNADPEKLEQGLAKLVLAVVDLLRNEIPERIDLNTGLIHCRAKRVYRLRISFSGSQIRSA